MCCDVSRDVSREVPTVVVMDEATGEFSNAVVDVDKDKSYNI
jgi:hypothetical protein